MVALRDRNPHRGPKRCISYDVLFLCCEICTRRLPRVAGEATKLNGGRPPFTSIELDMLKGVRRLHQRMEAGDYRMTEMELSLLMDVANWLIRLHAANKNQKTDKHVEVHGSAWQQNQLPPNSYAQAYKLIHSGAIDPQK